MVQKISGIVSLVGMVQTINLLQAKEVGQGDVT